MSEPWYDANLWGWLPGTTVGVLGGVWGSLAGVLGPRGKGKAVIWGGFVGLLVCGAAMFVAGIYALANDQPYGVWYGLLLPGIVSLLVVGPLGFVMRAAARRADERRMQAQELQ